MEWIFRSENDRKNFEYYQCLISDPPIIFVKRFPGPKFEHLREGSEIRLFCQIEANPEVEEISWYHWVRNINLLLQTISNGKFSSNPPFRLLKLSLSVTRKWRRKENNNHEHNSLKRTSALYWVRNKTVLRTVSQLFRSIISVCIWCKYSGYSRRFFLRLICQEKLICSTCNMTRSSKSKLAPDEQRWTILKKTYRLFQPIGETKFGVFGCWPKVIPFRLSIPPLSHQIYRKTI